jgi:acyl-CoA thioester hydrolase
MHAITVRVYYEDTDFSGAVYHANYLRFLERGRTEMVRAAGIDQASLHAATGLGFVVRRMAIDFLRPARMDDLLTVTTQPREVRGASMTLRQDILRGDELLLTAEVVVAAVRRGRAVRIPEALRCHARAGGHP